MFLTWDDILPTVSYANHLACRPGFRFGPRVNRDCQFIYVAAGSGTASIQDANYAAEAGALFYFGPGVVHRFQADSLDPFTLYGVHFLWRGRLSDPNTFMSPVAVPAAHTETLRRPNQVAISIAMRSGEADAHAGTASGRDDGADARGELEIGDCRLVDAGRFTPIFAALVEAYVRGERWTPLLLRARFLELIAALAADRGVPPLHTSEESRLVRIVAEQLCDRIGEPFRRSWLQAWTSYHPDHAARLFRAHTGTTPHAYFMKRKLEYAKKALAHTDDAVREIAERAGFSGIHAFSRWFRQQTGLAPLAFRKLSRTV